MYINTMYICRLVVKKFNNCPKLLINNISSFEGWYAKEAKDENRRLQLSIFLNELYEENLLSSSSSSSPLSASLSSSSSTIQSILEKPSDSIYKKFNHELNASNLNHYLDECLNNNTIVDEELLHATIIRSEKLLHDKPNVSVIVYLKNVIQAPLITNTN